MSQSLIDTLTRQQTEALGRRIADEIAAAQQVKSGLTERWRQSESLYRNEPGASGIRVIEGVEPLHIPLIQPQVDRICNSVFESLTAQYPMMQAVAESGDQHDADRIERLVQVMLDRAGFERVFPNVLRTAALCGLGILRLTLTNEGARLEPIHPNDFVVYPHSFPDLDRAKTVGHRFYLTSAEIDSLVRSGHCKRPDPQPSDDPDTDPSGRNPQYDLTGPHKPIEGDDDLLELWEVLTRVEIDGTQTTCRAVIEPHAGQLLALEKYPYSRPWYVDVRFSDEWGKFWPAGSIAQNLKDIQFLYSDLHNVMIWGSLVAAFPAMLLTGGSLGDKVRSYGPAQIIETPGAVQLQSVPVQFNAGAIPGMIEQVEKVAETVTRISRLGLGRQLRPNTTATEAASIVRYQNQGEQQYLAFAAQSVRALCELCQEFVRVHPGPIEAIYPSAAPSPLSAGSSPIRFEVTGRTQQNLPDALLEKLRFLLDLAHDPESGLDTASVIRAIMNALQLPTGIEKLVRNQQPEPQRNGQSETEIEPSSIYPD